jgi:predicted regulator of Ras-like GTPase activity (Roadblock/LC7/MglB family)/predicted Zn-dependent protease
MADEIRRLSDDLARDPSSLVFMPLADALRRAGQLDVALRVALRGLDRHPYVADAHDVLARIHADRGDIERAADEWEMALRLDPAHSQANMGLGFVDFRRGNLESAERRLSAAGTAEQHPGVATALAHVRTALGSRIAAVSPPAMPNASSAVPARAAAVAEVPAVATSQAKQLFAPALDAADQSALLVDADGLVLAGAFHNTGGDDVSDIVAAELAGVSSEAERAMRHLGLGAWTSLLVEADNAVVAMTPAPGSSLLVVAASRETPVGLVRLLLDRALTRARDWLARVS